MAPVLNAPAAMSCEIALYVFFYESCQRILVLEDKLTAGQNNLPSGCHRKKS
jgi:hypothetical protein